MELTDANPETPLIGRIRRPLLTLVLVAFVITIIFAIATPNLLRSRMVAPQQVDQFAMTSGSGVPMSSRTEAKSLSTDSAPSAPDVDLRKIVRSGSISLIVGDVLNSVSRIETIARISGGYVQSSSIARTDSDVRQATLRLSVPADHLDDVRSKLRAISAKVDSEQVQSQEVTAEYTDLQSSLRNFHAEEQQYLAIMQRAGTIRDTLEVARSLADVRGRIEHTQGRLNLIDHEAAMSTLDVSVRTDALPAPSWIRWQPVAHARASLRDALENLAGYVDFMVTVLMEVPVVLLWVLTIVAAVSVGWRLCRWTWRKLFVVQPVAS